MKSLYLKIIIAAFSARAARISTDILSQPLGEPLQRWRTVARIELNVNNRKPFRICLGCLERVFQLILRRDHYAPPPTDDLRNEAVLPHLQIVKRPILQRPFGCIPKVVEYNYDGVQAESRHS